MQMPFEWNRRVARLKDKYERGDELELERLIGEAVAAEREACAKIVLDLSHDPEGAYNAIRNRT